MNRRARLVLSMVFVGSIAACSGAGPAATQPAHSTAPGSTTSGDGTGAGAAGGAGGGGGSNGTTKAIGYDCTALISPAELDSASGLKGTTITQTGRGDQPSPGEVAGVTECLIENPSGSTWFGSFDVYTGDALSNFSDLWDFAKEQGATSIDGVGTEALYKNDESGTDIWARGANGLGASIALAWDPDTTSESAIRATLTKILGTVLSRT